MKNKYQKIIEVLGEQRVQLNEQLAKHTYFKIGGPADLFFAANDKQELIKSAEISRKLKVPYFILGGGSNILVSDKGFRGLVIKNRSAKIKFHKYTGKVKKANISIDEAQVTADSGVITNLLVRRTIQEGLSGLEYFLGVPGTIGGAVFNNAHYKDQLIGNVIDTVRVIDISGKIKEYNREQINFSYDYSLFQQTKELILDITFRLAGSDPIKLWEKAESYAKDRTESQPLNLPNSGCIFKNPERMGEIAKLKDQKNTSAGYLIDKAGLKGLKIGRAKVSEKHANFIVNTGNATASDVLSLVRKIRTEVNRQYGVNLEMEVFLVGDF